MQGKLEEILAANCHYKYSIIPSPTQSGSPQKYRVIFSKPTSEQPVSDIVDSEMTLEADTISIQLKHDSIAHPISPKKLEKYVEMEFKAKSLIRDGPYKHHLSLSN